MKCCRFVHDCYLVKHQCDVFERRRLACALTNQICCYSSHLIVVVSSRLISIRFTSASVPPRATSTASSPLAFSMRKFAPHASLCRRHESFVRKQTKSSDKSDKYLFARHMSGKQTTRNGGDRLRVRTAFRRRPESRHAPHNAADFAVVVRFAKIDCALSESTHDKRMYHSVSRIAHFLPLAKATQTT